MSRDRDPAKVVQMEEFENLDPEYINVDPLRERYRRNIARPEQRIKSLRQEHTALLCIDMQYLDAAPGHGIFADPYTDDSPEESPEYYFATLESTVLPNVRQLQDAFREGGLEVIHIRICSLTHDGRDRSAGHKRLALHAAPGSKEAEFLPEVAPEGDEIVINKTASGVFNSTNVEYVLKNMGIDSLFITGVLTDECVSTTVRDACDRGFAVTLVDDGCTTVTPHRHEFTIHTLKDRYTRVLSTAQAIEELREYAVA